MGKVRERLQCLNREKSLEVVSGKPAKYRHGGKIYLPNYEGYDHRLKKLSLEELKEILSGKN